MKYCLTEGKKSGAVHIATPHPSKQAVAKTPAGGSKSNQKSPATDGAHSCKSCNRYFEFSVDIILVRV